MTALLPKNLQSSLSQIVDRVNTASSSSNQNIRAILLSTAEGVSLGRVIANKSLLNERVLASLESTWAPASKASSLLLKNGSSGSEDSVKMVTAIYDHGTVLHVYQAPVVSFRL